MYLCRYARMVVFVIKAIFMILPVACCLLYGICCPLPIAHWPFFRIGSHIIGSAAPPQKNSQVSLEAMRTA